MKAVHRPGAYLLAILTCLLLSAALPAQESQTRTPGQQAAPSGETRQPSEHGEAATAPIPPEKAVATHHELALGGKTLKYTATAGTLLIRDEDDKPYGSIFYVAYTLDGADAQTRPVSFLYNGGPGSATLWLHMGSFSPVRIATDSPNADRRPALQAGAERVFAAGQDRPGLHRRAADRLLARRGQGDGQGLHGRGSGPARLRPLHPALPQREPALELAEVPHRRVLRHHALGGAGRHAGQRRRAAERRGADLARS